ncbi:MAG: hypothetical protein LBO73_04555 [Holosporaceae bacterium]|jgi:hypothetical protein|nr:hypothetical protein [Holosporaceae bacterium]
MKKISILLLLLFGNIHLYGMFVIPNPTRALPLRDWHNLSFRNALIPVSNNNNTFCKAAVRLAESNANVPHIAVARVVITDATNRVYSYVLPYLFLSGLNGNSAENRFCSAGLATEFDTVKENTIYIGTYGRQSQREAENGYPYPYSHSETAVGLFLLNNLQTIINEHNGQNAGHPPAHITVEIKTIRSMCLNCQNFWRNLTYLNGNTITTLPANHADIIVLNVQNNINFLDVTTSNGGNNYGY